MHLDDLSGNPFQPDLLFRGFTASPVEGETEGLAVYVNGARFNTPFGDTVNWDLIPPNAIAQVNVEGSSPLFGLNALGGSVVVRLKDGFDYQGGEFVAYGGSYGRAGSAVPVRRRIAERLGLRRARGGARPRLPRHRRFRAAPVLRRPRLAQRQEPRST